MRQTQVKINNFFSTVPETLKHPLRHKHTRASSTYLRTAYYLRQLVEDGSYFRLRFPPRPVAQVHLPGPLLTHELARDVTELSREEVEVGLLAKGVHLWAKKQNAKTNQGGAKAARE